MTYSGIGVFPNGLAFIAAHELDKRLVICRQSKSGDMETVANFHLPEEGVPGNAVPYGDSHVCVMDAKGRLWFFRVSLTTGSVEQVKVLRFEKIAALQAPRCGVYLRQTATLYVSSIPHSIVLPQGVAASPDGEQVYVGGLGHTIGIFNRDAESGALTLHDIVHTKVPGFSSLKYIVALRMTLDGRGLVVACRETESILVLDREANGKLKVRKEIAPKGDLAFRGLSDAVVTPDNDKVLFTSTGVILGAADARVAQPKK